MGALNTRQKILDASIRLFNINGIANVRLHHIADEIGISTGNLAYHFRNKSAIVDAVNENLYEEFLIIQEEYRTMPNLLDFDHQLAQYFAFIQKYPFFLLDIIEVKRNYPEISLKREIPVDQMIEQIRKRFDYNRQRGIMKDEPHPNVYNCLANTIWMLITFWVPQNVIRGGTDAVDLTHFKEIIWNQIYPHLTLKGVSEFEQLIRPVLTYEQKV
jgi:AcrR family transcriptional regulator